MMLVDVCDTLVVTVKPVEQPVRLVLLDTGITASLSENDLQNLKNVFTAVIIGDVCYNFAFVAIVVFPQSGKSQGIRFLVIRFSG